MQPPLDPADDIADLAEHCRDGIPAGRASAIFR
jgi:hypothetical protein